jgi:hypothetical protein
MAFDIELSNEAEYDFHRAIEHYQTISLKVATKFISLSLMP